MTTDTTITTHEALGILGATCSQRALLLKGRGRERMDALAADLRYDGTDQALAAVSADAIADRLRAAARTAQIPRPADKHCEKGKAVAQLDGVETADGYQPGIGAEVLARVLGTSTSEVGFDGADGALLRAITSKLLGLDITTLDPVPDEVKAS